MRGKETINRKLYIKEKSFLRVIQMQSVLLVNSVSRFVRHILILQERVTT